MRLVDSAPDEPATAALLDRYFDERAAGFPGPGAYHRATPDPAVFRAPGAFLRVDDPLPVAIGGIRPLPDGRMEVKHLFVVPETRGRGHGRALLEALETRARAAGATSLVLDTNRSLDSAARLYASAGFVPVEPYNDNPNATDWYGKPLV